MKKLILWFLISILVSMSVFSQTNLFQDSIKKGIELYGQGEWRESILELRKVTAFSDNEEELVESLFWIAMSEMNSGDYMVALEDINRVLFFSDNKRTLDALYQKGRILYYLGRQDEAIVILKSFVDAESSKDQKSAAYYWIGESLYSLGRLDEARQIFSYIIDQHPESAKYQPALYRIALIDQKSIETELLKLLKWSHEESLKTVEEYQKRERAYEQAILAYQKRITEMMKDTRLSDLETTVSSLKDQLLALEAQLQAEKNQTADLLNKLTDSQQTESQYVQKIADLENELADMQSKIIDPTLIEIPINIAASNTERLIRLLSIKSEALEIKEIILNKLLQQTGNNEGLK